MKKPLLTFTNRGIYCERADLYLDPWKPVDKAIITHGHSDHARWGHRHYLAHHDTIPIMKHRLGDIQTQGVTYGESFTVNGVRFSLHPAGHIPGSAQVRVAYRDEVWVFTGDFKTEADGISTPYENLRCHAMITECTFGLPVFRWEPQETVAEAVNQWWRTNRENGQNSVLFAYSLGKAQRILHMIDPSIGPIYTHGAVEQMTEVLRPKLSLPPTTYLNREISPSEVKGALIIAPPSAQGTPWLRKYKPYVTASASGWMALRGARRRRAVDRGFVISDHADWQGLLEAVEASGCEHLIATHGYTELFARYLREQGLDARTEASLFEGELLHETEATEIES